jgi:4-hydroxy-4-methyl-2-oxoglutarate aldolase
MTQDAQSKERRSQFGSYQPPLVGEQPDRPDSGLYGQLLGIPGLSSTVSDVLDRLGYHLAVPATYISPLVPGSAVVGPAITLRYLPVRDPGRNGPSRLAHQAAFATAQAGDILVVEGDRDGIYSVMGGLAARDARKVGLAACLVDGAVRDVDEILAAGLPVWSRGTTPITGRNRLEGASLNMPIRFGGVQVQPGDIVVADASGICFVPREALEEVCREVLEIHEEESGSSR